MYMDCMMYAEGLFVGVVDYMHTAPHNVRYHGGVRCMCAVWCSARLYVSCDVFIGPVHMCSMMQGSSICVV